MKKTLNESGITSELRGQSAFFPKAASPSPVVAQEPVEATPQRAAATEMHEPRNVPTNEQPIQRSFERKKVRHTFDIFHDQLLSLREMALKREIEFGGRTLLGDLVQEALDMFITKERNKE